MRKLIIPILVLTLLLSGCSALLVGEYHSVKPHASDGIKIPDDVVTVSGYAQMQEALLTMVISGKQESTFYIDGFDLETADKYMETAMAYVVKNSAIGAYAVDEITYESGTSGGAAAIAVKVTYLHGRQEILRIKNVNDMESVKTLVGVAIKNCDPSLVIKVKDYQPWDITLFVQEYANKNPNICMEIPQITANLYPDNGKERVMEISFTYINGRDSLRNMQNIVAPIFSAAELYVQGSENRGQKYEQLYSFLMERFNYTIETSITPTYSLLRYGVGDSRAFALVYSKMCQNADLECRVISGTRNGEAHYWNQIRYDDIEYHVDLLACNEAGEFSIMIPSEMTGYVWDYTPDQ